MLGCVEALKINPPTRSLLFLHEETKPTDSQSGEDNSKTSATFPELSKYNIRVLVNSIACYFKRMEWKSIKVTAYSSTSSVFLNLFLISPSGCQVSALTIIVSSVLPRRCIFWQHEKDLTNSSVDQTNGELSIEGYFDLDLDLSSVSFPRQINETWYVLVIHTWQYLCWEFSIQNQSRLRSENNCNIRRIYQHIFVRCQKEKHISLSSFRAHRDSWPERVAFYHQNSLTVLCSAVSEQKHISFAPNLCLQERQLVSHLFLFQWGGVISSFF